METPQSKKKSQALANAPVHARGKLGRLVTVTAPHAKNGATVLQGNEEGKLELKHASGFSIGIDARTDPVLLKKVLKVLGELITA